MPSVVVNGYPFENQDTTETQYSRLAREWAGPGVMAAVGSGALSATLPGGMNVRVAAGRAHGNGFVLDNPANTDVPLDPSESQARVDRIVARVDPVLNTASLVAIKGTRGTAVPPAITRTDTGAYDVKLYRVHVPAGAAGPTLLVDEREWIDTRVGRWTTDNRPTGDDRRPWTIGINLTTGRLERWDATSGWVHYLEQSDALKLRYVYALTVLPPTDPQAYYEAMGGEFRRPGVETMDETARLIGTLRNRVSLTMSVGPQYHLGSLPTSITPQEVEVFPAVSTAGPGYLKVTPSGDLYFITLVPITGAPAGTWWVHLSGWWNLANLATT